MRASRAERARPGVGHLADAAANSGLPHHRNMIYEGMGRKRTPTELVPAESDDAYALILDGIAALLESARHAAARSVNSIMTRTYWDIGRRIVEEEQRGRARATYGKHLIERLSRDLTARFGRGFSEVNLKQMRKFYVEWSTTKISQTASDQFAGGTHPFETEQTYCRRCGPHVPLSQLRPRALDPSR
jgi:hypothetical protein